MKKSSQPNLFSVTEVELTYHNKINTKDRRIVKSSSDAFEILMNSWDMSRIDLVEEFMILLLDRNSQCLGLSRISQGGVSACIVDPKIVFATSLKAMASSIILAHNHPSRNLRPSEADTGITNRLREAGRVLEINVLDHLIISPEGYFSFTDDGIGLKIISKPRKRISAPKLNE
jgi:DNA repair protein RadC